MTTPDFPASEQAATEIALDSIAHSISRTSTLLGMLMGSIFLLTFGIIAFLTQKNEIEVLGATQAITVEKFIAARPDTWEYSTDRLQAAIEKQLAPEQSICVKGADGSILLDLGKPDIFFTYSERPLYLADSTGGCNTLDAA